MQQLYTRYKIQDTRYKIQDTSVYLGTSSYPEWVFLQKSSEQSAPKKHYNMHVQVIRYLRTGDDEIETNWGLLR